MLQQLNPLVEGKDCIRNASKETGAASRSEYNRQRWRWLFEVGIKKLQFAAQRSTENEWLQCKPEWVFSLSEDTHTRIF